MHHVRNLSASVSVAILAAPTYGASQATTTDKIPLRLRMGRPSVLGVSVLAALSMLSVGVLLYAVAGQGGRNLEAVQVPASVDRPPADPFAGYRSQMTLAQETLTRFGYEPGPIDGIMRFKTASALRAFQEAHGLSVTGRSNPETLAILGIEDKLLRRRR